MAPRGSHVTEPREFSSGKRYRDIAHTRHLLRDDDGTVYARRCLGCGNADKVYQTRTHLDFCPVELPPPHAYFCLTEVSKEEPLPGLPERFATWGEADAAAVAAGLDHKKTWIRMVRPE